ncbi:sulfite exporter TauE/SafE family protein [Phycisphaera mikurensis]|uniref:Probable membrane transporter protein n=1 Tax=Phycisphaera mikurensis (strain NBRC 102666 / KCTC 22515 / FYK2301M01) TaxID=1142394 RepID=I0IB59_PHYMF|nr:sulfite exporter TauE/SafE family protein [Phycisphaera mikurensis]MBB6442997.1 hypothetical protein [Phycisphaera mikurensis]BAM02497.1 hypothetical protein PSMK_03380 [Phycisphaera mikurensis NBRC 102666]
MPDLASLDLLLIALLGLAAGLTGGMLGIGGSTVIIPGLAVVLGPAQHLFQAAAMIVNVAVSAPAAWGHWRAGAVRLRVLAWLLPAALAGVLAGVGASNLELFRGRDGGLLLGRCLAAFLLYAAVANAWKIIKGRRAARHAGAGDTRAADEAEPPVRPGRTVAIGGAMGGTAGLLGIGGGAVAVPLQQLLLKLPLRQAIANSSCAICVSAGIGAVLKNATLPQHVGLGGVALTPTSGLYLAALLAPTAFVGGRLGAMLTHRLPLEKVRAAFVVLMLVAAWKMAAG